MNIELMNDQPLKTVFDAIRNGLVDGAEGDAARLFHGRGQTFAGLGYINVDWFRPVLLITLYAEPPLVEWQSFVDALSQLPSVFETVIVQRRYLRGSTLETLKGSMPSGAEALECGLSFELSFSNRQNIGFFLDMSPGRAWLRERTKGKRVLNLFAYTCSLSVAAIAGGAASVMNVDMSRAALTVGRQNHRRNGHDSQLKRDIQFLPYDIFRSWKKIISRGPYDIVIIDPPSRQKGSFIAEKDYARVVRRLPALMPAGGDVLACLNAPELETAFLTEIFSQECPQAGLQGRLTNRPDFPEANPERNLKLLLYRF